MNQADFVTSLQTQIEYVGKYSNFYQRKLAKTTLSDDILESFTSLPFTTKQELLLDQEQHPPFGSNLCASLRNCKRVHKTSGTTNKPLLIVLTENDIHTTISVGKRCFQSSGLTENDIVVHCLNYNMWMGGYTDHQSLEATGAAVIPFGVGNTHNLVDTILTIRPSAIHCTPSYLGKIELLLRDEFSLRPIDLGLKLGLFGAESGLQNDNFRKKIENKWGLKAMNANYGLADVLSMLGAECYRQEGLHFMAEDVLYPELINPDSLENIAIEPGNVGELVLTHLFKEAQPLIRYRTNDIIKILSVNKCTCGGTGFKFEIVGRSDDMFVVKGVNVFVNAIEKVISEHLDSLSGNYQVHISQLPPVDQIQIRVEIIESACKDEIIEKLLFTFKARLNICPQIVLLENGELPRTEGKSKKLFKTLN